MMISPFVWGENIVRKILPGAILFTVLIYASSIIFEQTGMLGERWTADEVSSDFDERFSRSLLLLSKASESLGSFLFGLGNSASFSPNLIGIYPHIVPLEILGEEGLIGLFLFVTICYMVIRTFLKILKNKMVTSEEKKIVCVNFGFWLFTVLLCFKQSSLITSPNIFLFAALHEKLMALIYLRIKQGKSA